MAKDIAEQIIEEIQARKAKGVETYGKPLTPFNKRDSTQDALEEALDLAHYIKQWQVERNTLIWFLKDISFSGGDCFWDIRDRAVELLEQLGEE